MSRLRRRVLPVLAGLLVVAGLVALVLARSSSSTTPLAPDNPEPAGAQAAATILDREGVQVSTVRTTADALALAEADTTLFVTAGGDLTTEQLAALRDTGADLVLSGLTFAADLTPLTSAVEPSPAGSPDLLTARCDVPHAQAAAELSGSTGAVRPLSPEVELCFPTTDDAGAFATWSQDGRQVSVLADASLLSNADLDQAGNAALALRVLGEHEQLTWYLPSVGDTYGQDGDPGAAGSPQLLPPEATAVGWWLLLLAGVVLVWGARRLGPVVTEALPVVVRATETTLGRGRLYRRGRAHGHAAAGLRAGCASRIGRSLGLPHAAPPGTLVPAVAAATGRDEESVGRLLYGPAPADDAQLLTLTRELDILESEVHRT